MNEAAVMEEAAKALVTIVEQPPLVAHQPSSLLLMAAAPLPNSRMGCVFLGGRGGEGHSRTARTSITRSSSLPPSLARCCQSLMKAALTGSLKTRFR